MSKPWTEEEENILKEYYPIEGKEVMKRIPNRSSIAITRKIEKLHLHLQNRRKCNIYDLSGEYGIGYTSNTSKPFYFDLDEYDLIKNFTWAECHNYIRASTKHRQALHHIVIGEQNIPRDMLVDHINHDTFDNRLQNLRIVTPSDNCKNKNKLKDSKNIYVGVEKHKSGNYKAYICVNKQRIYLGVFQTIEEAIKVRTDAELKYFGEYRNSNLDELIKDINYQSVTPKKIKGNSSKKWTTEEMDVLEKYYPIEGSDCVKRLPQKTKKQISNQARRHNIKYIKRKTNTTYSIWTEDEVNTLKQWYPIEGVSCAKRFNNRSEKSIAAKAFSLKLKYIGNKSNTEEYTQINLFDEQEER